MRNRIKFFNEVYTHVFPLLLRVVYQIVGTWEVAEEVCHEAFFRFYKESVRFPDTKQAQYWLLRVGKNLAFNVARRQIREHDYIQDIQKKAVFNNAGMEKNVMEKEAISLVRKNIHLLPPHLRDVIVLREYGEFSYGDIARILKISVANVKIRIYRARLRLADGLRDMNDDISS